MLKKFYWYMQTSWTFISTI